MKENNKENKESNSINNSPKRNPLWNKFRYLHKSCKNLVPQKNSLTPSKIRYKKKTVRIRKNNSENLNQEQITNEIRFSPVYEVLGIKPKDYKIEAEVRVLYENKKIKKPHWFLAKPINVLSSYIDVELNDDFPLKLKEIILGPKCPEKETNRDQLNVLLKRMDFENVKVDFSKIDNYR